MKLSGLDVVLGYSETKTSFDTITRAIGYVPIVGGIPSAIFESIRTVEHWKQNSVNVRVGRIFRILTVPVFGPVWAIADLVYSLWLRHKPQKEQLPPVQTVPASPPPSKRSSKQKTEKPAPKQAPVNGPEPAPATHIKRTPKKTGQTSWATDIVQKLDTFGNDIPSLHSLFTYEAEGSHKLSCTYAHFEKLTMSTCCGEKRAKIGTFLSQKFTAEELLKELANECHRPWTMPERASLEATIDYCATLYPKNSDYTEKIGRLRAEITGPK